MKGTEKNSSVNVGRLIGELEEYEEKYWHYNVVCSVQDDEDYRALGIVGKGLDEDGDLRIEMEEMEDEEGFYSVSDTLDALKEYDRDVKVYLAGCGLYLSIDSDGSIFAEADEDDENVGFYAGVFGRYQEKRRSVWRTEAEERELAEKERQEKRKSRAETIVLAILTVGAAVLLVYKVYGLVARTGGPLWENILWIVGSIVCLIVGEGTLYYSKDNN